MDGLGALINTIVSFIVTLVEGYGSNSVAKKLWDRQGAETNAVINNLQERYGNLENQIGEAVLTQEQAKIESDTRKKVITGNLVSVVGVVFVLVILIVLFMLIVRKK